MGVLLGRACEPQEVRPLVGFALPSVAVRIRRGDPPPWGRAAWLRTTSAWRGGFGRQLVRYPPHLRTAPLTDGRGWGARFRWHTPAALFRMRFRCSQARPRSAFPIAL